MKAVPATAGSSKAPTQVRGFGCAGRTRFLVPGWAGPANGIVAHNLEELRRILPTCSDDTLRHHASGHEFSRWVDTVFADHTLAAEMAPLESKIERAEDATQLRQACGELEAVIADGIRSARARGELISVLDGERGEVRSPWYQRINQANAYC